MTDSKASKNTRDKHNAKPAEPISSEQSEAPSQKSDSNSAPSDGPGQESATQTSPIAPGECAPGTEELTRRLLYLQAEFENYKTRLLRDQDQAIRLANERFVKELMPIVDLFDHALQNSKPLVADSNQRAGQETRDFVAGIELIHRELIQVLKRFGVELVGAEGEKFDPNRHEAISQLEAPPEKVDCILSILRRGCILNGRLIEPAKVIVGKAKDLASPSQGES